MVCGHSCACSDGDHCVWDLILLIIVPIIIMIFMFSSCSRILIKYACSDVV